MPLYASKNVDFDFELIPAGTHIARCYMVCDLGFQEIDYQGHKKSVRQVRLAFECPELLMEEGENVGKPFSISKEYTLSLNEKSNLYNHLVSWRGKEFTEEELERFDLESLLDIPAMVNVIHKKSKTSGNIYPVIQSISKPHKSITCPKLTNNPVVFSLDDSGWENIYKELPEWLQKKINTDLPHKEQVDETDEIEIVDDNIEITDEDIIESEPENTDEDYEMKSKQASRKLLVPTDKKQLITHNSKAWNSFLKVFADLGLDREDAVSNLAKYLSILNEDMIKGKEQQFFGNAENKRKINIGVFEDTGQVLF